MLKTKYLHRKYRKCSREYYSSDHRRLYKGKNIDLLNDDLPTHVKIRPYSYKNSIDFRPLVEFLDSKIGKNWDDVYSEILTKIKNKFRYQLESLLSSDRWYSCISRPIYDEKFIPRDKYGRIFYDTIYIDYNNIIVKKSEEEIMSDSIRIVRKMKILKILESQEEENQSS